MTAAHRGRTLAVPALPGNELLGAIAAELGRREFDARTMTIGAAESRLFPERAVALRLSVLLRTYEGDYHTDSFDFARLTAQVRDGDEAIWFWGAPAAIERARDQLRQPTGTPVPDLPLGTVTVLSAEAEFGPGHGELCRSASMDRSTGAVAAILHRMAGYHSGIGDPTYGRYHTLLLAARNRASTAEARGGEPVQHIHCHYVQSRFWGIVPFYVMRGGVIECTELRESNRDPEDVRDCLATSSPWYFADRRDAAYAQALCRLNFGFESAGTVLTGEPGAPGAFAQARARLLLPPHPSLVPTNHATVRVAEGTDLFPVAIRQAEDSGVCCVAVHLGLQDPLQAGYQGWLVDRGYVLTALSPPKRTWRQRAGLREPVSVGAAGVWCRTRADLPVAAPYYLEREGADATEQAVLHQLRERCLRLRAGQR